jgi:hypothetical protein
VHPSLRSVRFDLADGSSVYSVVMATASLVAITARRMPPLRSGHPLVIAPSLRFVP